MAVVEVFGNVLSSPVTLEGLCAKTFSFVERGMVVAKFRSNGETVAGKGSQYLRQHRYVFLILRYQFSRIFLHLIIKYIRIFLENCSILAPSPLNLG